MGTNAEQFGRDKRFVKFSRHALKFAKRAFSKFQRRQGKKMLDRGAEGDYGYEAPVRRQYQGWLG